MNDESPASPVRLGALQPAVRQIATDALAVGVGANLPTNAQYRHEHQIGAGTVQRALRILEDREAVWTTSHGHLGRSIDALDVGKAWQAGGLQPVRLLLPPGGAAEIDVLETILAEELTALGIPHTVHHRRGGALRLASVRRGDHDIAVVSAGVSRDETSNHDRIDNTLTRQLPNGTYYAPGRLAVIRSAAAFSPPVRIAIDNQSPDHSALTLAEYPQGCGYVYVEIPFTGVPAAVLRREVDAGIWHLQHSVIPLDLAGLAALPLERRESHVAWERLSAAVLRGWSGRPELGAVVASLRLDELRTMQAHAIRLTSESPDT